MSNKTTPKKPNSMSAEQRRLRRNQILFGIISVILILSWILSLLVHI